MRLTVAELDCRRHAVTDRDQLGDRRTPGLWVEIAAGVQRSIQFFHLPVPKPRTDEVSGFRSVIHLAPPLHRGQRRMGSRLRR
jgi:hypothetical protein